MVSGRQRRAVHLECSRLDIVMSHPEGRPLIPWQGEGSLCNFTWCNCVNQFLLTLNILGHKVSLTIPHRKNFVLSPEIYICVCFMLPSRSNEWWKRCVRCLYFVFMLFLLSFSKLLYHRKLVVFVIFWVCSLSFVLLWIIKNVYNFHVYFFVELNKIWAVTQSRERRNLASVENREWKLLVVRTTGAIRVTSHFFVCIL